MKPTPGRPKRPLLPVVEIAHPSYQPKKAELEEPIKFPEGTTPEDLARALTQPVEVRYVAPRNQR